jgi:hypothetical protein
MKSRRKGKMGSGNREEEKGEEEREREIPITNFKVYWKGWIWREEAILS